MSKKTLTKTLDVLDDVALVTKWFLYAMFLTASIWSVAGISFNAF